MSSSWNCSPWPIATHCLPAGWDPNPALWDEGRKFSRAMAQEILNTLSGGVYGFCTVKVRPCRKTCSDGWRIDPLRYAPMGVGTWVPVLRDGEVFNTRACGCGGGSCGCSPLCEIPLFPMVAEQTPEYRPRLEVRVDGLLLPPTAVRVDDRRRLIRVDGQCWPECQQMGLPDTAPGTFSVLYETGTLVPLVMQMALAELTVHVYDSCITKQSADCSGSPNSSFVTRIDRGDISYEFDPIAMYSTGKTGLPRVDMALALGNPSGSRSTFQAWSPDLVRHQRTTWEVATMACSNFVHTQAVAAAVWEISNPLGCCPAQVHVQLPDGRDLIGGDIECLESDPAQVTITFNKPYAGTATLS